MKVRLENLTKVFPSRGKDGVETRAVDNFTYDIPDGKLIGLLGPSGCGKSTTLFMLSGLLKPSSGKIYFGEDDVTNLTPEKRGVGLVFQNYALYPHMTVYENMAFGLKIRNYTKEEIDARVKIAAETLQITEYLSRRPKELSGGQRQRVALGRAIVREAKVFLMDEPLSNLDAKLRVSMRSEIIKLHKKIKATTIYVTHDQTEAMTMADRIVVMKDGYIQQIGTPEDIYNFPANTFVATFIGTPAMNLVNCKYQNGRLIFGNGFEIQLSEEQVLNHNKFYEKQIELLQQRLENKEYENVDTSLLLSYREESGSLKTLFQKKITYNKVKTPEEKKYELEEQIKVYKSYLTEGHPIIFGIRPEDIYENGELASNVKPSSPLKLFISVSELLGSEYHLHMDFMEQDVIAKCKVVNSIKSETYINVVFDLNRIHLFDENNKKAIF